MIATICSIYKICVVTIKTNIFGKVITAQHLQVILQGGGGGYFWQFLVGVCRPVLQILTLFQTKTCHFHIRFQTRPRLLKRWLTLNQWLNGLIDG